MHTPNASAVVPKQDVYDQLLKSRIIWLGEDVRDDNSNRIISQLLLLAADDPEKDIYFVINSPGGSVTSGSGIYDAMTMIPNDVVTIGIGMCASMGQFLLTAGTQGKRYITPLARVLLHQPSGGWHGTQTDVVIEAELIEKMKNTLAGITAKNTGKTLEEINLAGDRDAWYDANEALEFGFVDHVASSFAEIFNSSQKVAK